jgi:hypothetical protein
MNRGNDAGTASMGYRQESQQIYVLRKAVFHDDGSFIALILDRSS